MSPAAVGRAGVPVLAVGLLYLVISLLFGALAGAAGSVPLRTAFRVAAWVVALVVLAWHTLAEAHAGATTPRAAARVALAVALGGFLLAAAANVHDLLAGLPARRSLRLALVVFPLMTGIPAAAGALAVIFWLRRDRHA